MTLDTNDVILRLGETATVGVKVEDSVISSISAESANAAIVTAAVKGNAIILTPVAVGKTTVDVYVSAEGIDGLLTDTITVEVLSADAGEYTIKLTATGKEVSMVDVKYQTLLLETAQEQQVSIPLSTAGASYVTAILTDSISKLHPLAEACSVPIQHGT